MISRGSVCTLMFGKCCPRSISRGGGAQVTVALSHPERSGGSLFCSKPSPPCSDPTGGKFRRPRSVFCLHANPRSSWNKSDVGMRRRTSTENSHLLHVEIVTALPWLPPHSEEKSKSSQQSCMTCPHHLPAPISSILPLGHLPTAILASSIFLKHTRHLLLPGPLHLLFSFLECSFPRDPQDSLPLFCLFSFLILSEAFYPISILNFFLGPCPQTSAIFFSFTWFLCFFCLIECKPCTSRKLCFV